MAKYSLRELLVRTGAPLSLPPTYQSQTASREPEACFSKGKIFENFQVFSIRKTRHEPVRTSNSCIEYDPIGYVLTTRVTCANWLVACFSK